jgi:hypothetical protein
MFIVLWNRLQIAYVPTFYIAIVESAEIVGLTPVIVEMKCSDFVLQHRALFCCRNTIIVLSSFLDAFQKIADAATNTKGRGLSKHK